MDRFLIIIILNNIKVTQDVFSGQWLVNGSCCKSKSSFEPKLSDLMIDTFYKIKVPLRGAYSMRSLPSPLICTTQSLSRGLEWAVLKYCGLTLS